MRRLLITVSLIAIVSATKILKRLNDRINKNQKMIYEEFDRLDQHLKKILAD